MNTVKYNHRRPAHFSPFFDDAFTRGLFSNQPVQRSTSGRFPTNIRETNEAFELELAAPGFAKENFELELKEDQLVITATRETTETKDNPGYYRKEFGSTSMKRTFSVPENVDGDKVDARFENGVLHVTLPKKEVEQVKAAKRIEVG